MNKQAKVQTNFNILFFDKPQSAYAESYRKIPINLAFSTVDRNVKVIQLTSAVPSENKTTTTVNLAAAYAEIGKKVLIIDLDLRRPKVHRYFKIPNDEGLTTYLIDKTKEADLIKQTETGIDVINSGPSVPSPHVVLRSAKLLDLLNRVKEFYDVILLDTPPVLLITDSLLIAPLADATVFVVNQNISKKQESKEAVRLLQDNKANLVGVVFTGRRKGRLYAYTKYGYATY